MPTELRRPERTFTIRQLCTEFKATPRALRFYEDKGLLTPARDGMNRVYSYKDRARLILILRGKRLGFSLRDISDYLSLYDANRSQQVSLLTAKVDERLASLERQLQDLQTTIAELKEIRKLADGRLEKAS